jgi:hypothetical protein
MAMQMVQTAQKKKAFNFVIRTGMSLQSQAKKGSH